MSELKERAKVYEYHLVIYKENGGTDSTTVVANKMSVRKGRLVFKVDIKEDDDNWPRWAVVSSFPSRITVVKSIKEVTLEFQQVL